MGWLSGWQYRKSHEIEGSTAGAQTDYQIKITVHYGSGADSGEDVYLNGKCRTDFGDIRFTDSDGVTELSYWMEEKVDGDHAVFWVKVPSIPASPDTTTIYIYYGKSDATTTSNGENTFIFFDHFEGTSLDTNKWTDGSDGDGSVSVADSKVHLYAPNSPLSHGFIYSSLLGYYDSIALRLSVDCQSIGNDQVQLNPLSGVTQEDDLARITVYDQTYDGGGASDVSYNIKYGGTQEEVARDENVGDTWTKCPVEIRIRQDLKVNYNVEGVDKGTSTNALNSNNWRIRLVTFSGRGVSDLYVDWVALRKYVDPEPSHGSWGSEETAILETITARELPTTYYAQTPTELRSKISGATITRTAQTYPHQLHKKGQAQELKSKWT